MIELYAHAAKFQSLLRHHAWPFCFIGGVALQRWGEPRLTQDIDVTILTGFGGEAPVIEALLALYAPRVPSPQAFALQNRVLLLKTSENIGIDVALGALPFEEECIQRASDFEFLPDVNLRTASAEDLIVMKAFANRGKDWVDIEGMIERQRVLDWSYVMRQLAPLVELKEEPEILSSLAKLRHK